MRLAAAEAQSLQDKLAKAISAVADMEQLVESKQLEMQEAQRAMEEAYKSHKSALGTQVDQTAKAREQREHTPEDLRELDNKIYELIGGASASSPEEIAEQLKQAAQKCYEAFRAKLAAEAQAAHSRAASNSYEQPCDDDEDDKLSSIMEATSGHKRPAEDKQEASSKSQTQQSSSSIQLEGPEIKRSRERSPTIEQGGKGAGAGKGKGLNVDTGKSTSQG